MAVSVFASGGMPDACKHGHSWLKPHSFMLSWVTCLCPAAQGNGSGFGHHRARCMTPGCSSVWMDPPHVPGG
jgi:hypothetical protein